MHAHTRAHTRTHTQFLFNIHGWCPLANLKVKLYINPAHIQCLQSDLSHRVSTISWSWFHGFCVNLGHRSAWSRFIWTLQERRKPAGLMWNHFGGTLNNCHVTLQWIQRRSLHAGLRPAHSPTTCDSLISSRCCRPGNKHIYTHTWIHAITIIKVYYKLGRITVDRLVSTRRGTLEGEDVEKMREQVDWLEADFLVLCIKSQSHTKKKYFYRTRNTYNINSNKLFKKSFTSSKKNPKNNKARLKAAVHDSNPKHCLSDSENFSSRSASFLFCVCGQFSRVSTKHFV